MRINIFFVLGILIFSSFTVLSIGKETGKEEISINLQFLSPTIQESESQISVDIEDANTCLYSAGKPILPMYTTKFDLPFGTRIKNIECTTSEIKSIILTKKIKPAADPVIPDIANSIPKLEMDKTVYNSNELFPDNWFSYFTAGGLDENNNHKTFLNLQIYPVRYIPTIDKIYYIEKIGLKITYEKPNRDPFPQTTEDQLLIITPKSYSNILNKLIDHKNSLGFNTHLVTLDEIYNGDIFPKEGRDDAESIKYFIKNAMEQWGAKYVLLVGGRIPGIRERWHCPVRYVNIVWGKESTYISDLYFADIYDGEGNFSSWDTNDNGIYGEWPNSGPLRDKMDLYPDVNIGRLPCRFSFELSIMVNKIIAYENSQISKKIVLSGGDNFDDIEYGGNNESEGEYVCEKTIEYLPDFEAARVYASQTDVTPQNIRRALGKGGIFMHLHGHGSPLRWSTCKPLKFEEWEEGLAVKNIPYFFNREYPIVVIGGCHTSMFSVSMTVYQWDGPSIRGLSDWFVLKFLGGAIATLGYTCFPVASPGENGDLDGDGINEPDCVESGYGYMQLRFFYAYGEKNLQYLGECWKSAISDYSDSFKSPNERHHIHTIHGFVLLGDPSLKIGGYEK